ncbi:MAG: hypothetical protein IEMM0002_0894 [bacterium]|nr:MAG: hypothetical protein IEMM0002_0894 [bacterium]
MPIYEYECKKCGEDMEIVHGITEKPKTRCPECGGKLKRLISLNSFHLKGTGWYKTDYAAKPKGDEKNHKPKAEAEKKSKEEKTSEKSNAAA